MEGSERLVVERRAARADAAHVAGGAEMVLVVVAHRAVAGTRRNEPVAGEEVVLLQRHLVAEPAQLADHPAPFVPQSPGHGVRGALLGAAEEHAQVVVVVDRSIDVRAEVDRHQLVEPVEGGANPPGRR